MVRLAQDLWSESGVSQTDVSKTGVSQTDVSQTGISKTGVSHTTVSALRKESKMYTLLSLKVDLNPKSEIVISRQFSMNFSNRIDESNKFFKAFQMVITIAPRTSKIAPRSSRYPPGSRSTFKLSGLKRAGARHL